MRHYTNAELQMVNAQAEIIQENGLEIVVKPSPSESRKGYIDRMLWETLKDSPWLRGNDADAEKPKLSQAEAIEAMRNNMGGFNENINSVEIYTKYEEIKESGNRVGLWRYYPRKAEKLKNKPALIEFHGGGWCGGSVYVVENACRYIAEKADAVVFNVDYSLAPEKPFPNGLNDNYAALCHVFEHAEEYGVDRNRIAVCGDSAGGNYAAAVAQMAREKGYPHIALEVLIYPALLRGDKLPDGYAWSDTMLGVCAEQYDTLRPLLQLGKPEPVERDVNYQMYCPDQDPGNPYVSPARAVSLSGLPPALLFAGEFDGLRIQTEYYARRLKEADVPVRCVRYRGLGHAFIDMMGILPQTEDMCLEIAAALKSL